MNFFDAQSAVLRKG